jgi:glycolate oxidase iron-sulfur subunit
MTPEQLKEAIDLCVRCGRCLAGCPVYRLTGWEGSVARGKLALLRAELTGEENLEDRMKNLLSHCLLCGACAEGCASGVKGDEIIQAGRTLAVKDGGLAKLKSLLTRDVLSRGPVQQGLWKGRSLFLKNVPEESGLHFRFPMPGLDRDRWLPQPAIRTFLNSSRQLHPGPGPRVALFVGCVSNFLRPQSAEAAVRLLENAGATVIIPPDQVCCGKPAAGAGDARTARFLAERNARAFDPADFDYLTTFCATCSEQLLQYRQWPDLPQGAALAEKVVDLSRLLQDVLAWKPDPGPSDSSDRAERVFYHDPCHLRRKQGIFREPRDLLRALPGVELVGADEAPVCCGYGGLFNLWHYDLSQDLFKIRADTIRPHAPDLVVTSCSGCWLQFEDCSRGIGQPFRTMPLVEILAERGLPQPGAPRK